MNIVILAAGKGKRMNSDLPKVLHPIAGQPMLVHLLKSVWPLAPHQIIVVIGHGGELVKKTLENTFINHPLLDKLRFVTQAEQLGTGHAVRLTSDLLDNQYETLVLYGDVPLTSTETIECLAKAGNNERLALVTVNLDPPTGYGRIIRDNHHQITGVVEEKDANAEQKAIKEVNTGLVCAPTTALKRWLANLQNHNAQQEYYLTDIVAMAAQDRIVITAIEPENTFETDGVNSKRQLAQLERVYQNQQAFKLLDNGVTLLDYTRIDIRGHLHCGRDVSIDVGCVFSGQVTLGDRVKIGPYCVIENATIADDTEIHAYSNICNSQVGASNKIGPYARLRPGTQTAVNAHIGNFVELKNTVLGENSKANHLAYIGDALIGKNVNIGAGTITCNYDGVNKFQTIIEDDAFIGSDSQLVAPVTIGKGATLGAGTTLSKDAPAGELTISRVRQQVVPGWQRPVKK